MGTCMLSNSNKKSLNEPVEELTSSIRTQIRSEVQQQFENATFEGPTGKFQKTASYDMALASKEIELDEPTFPKQELMNLKVSATDEDQNSGFFRVKDSNAPFSSENEETQMRKQRQNTPNKVLDDFSHISHFSFQMKSLKQIYNEDDYTLLKGVTDQKQRLLILGTLKTEKPIKLNKITFNNGQTYEGEWMCAKRHGKGKNSCSKGIYEGQWDSNKISGKGVFVFSNKDRYEGEFLEGLMHGMGKLQDRSGSIYDGEFKNGKKDGFGIEVYDHGQYYEGDWKDGYKHGKGHLQFNDGSYCRGQFMDNFIHGQAQYYWAGQKKYHGKWALNKLEGQGVMEWEDGRKYEGGYANDKMEGRGTYIYRNGQSFTGFWRNNKKNGKGEYTDQNGKVIKGIWYEDRLIEQYVNISSTKRCAITSLANLTETKD